MASLLAVARLHAARQGFRPPAYAAYAPQDRAQFVAALTGPAAQVPPVSDWFAVGLFDFTGESEPRDREVRGLPPQRVLGLVTQPGAAPAFLPNGQLKPPAPEHFRLNELFLSALQEAVRAGLVDCPLSIEEAKAAKGGWHLLRDFRAPNPRNTAVDPTEFFGAVAVDGTGVMDPASYQPNEYYHVLSPIYGFPRLSNSMLKHFLHRYPASF
jgi:hypothetical protein